jgi:TnpA family transposase
VRRGLELDELIEHWTLVGEEMGRACAKRGVNALAFALLLKFVIHYGRFPRGCSEIPDEAVEFVARQVQVGPGELGFYEWSGRSIERHRAEIRELLDYQECSLVDQAAATDWLVETVTQLEHRPEQVRAELLGWCREHRREPPTSGRIDRIVRSALDRGEKLLIERVTAMLPEEVRTRLNGLVFGVPDEPDTDGGGGPGERDVLAWVKSDPGRLSLNTVLDEISKLEAIRAVGLPLGLLATVPPKIVSGWRVRAAVQSPSHFRQFAAETRWVLLAALLMERQREITDTLVELLISTVHAINARADHRVTEEMVASFKRVRNKDAILARISEASRNRPEGAVREVVFPVAGGEQTLRDVVAEYKANGPEFRRNVQVKLRSSYSHHYRVGMVRLLRTLTFRSNNTMHQPIIEGIALVLRHAEGRLQSYPKDEAVPLTGVVEGDWVELAYRGNPASSRVVRTVYEVCLFRALRERLRCKEIWVEGADRWRNPEHDLPADFEARRGHYYAELSKPLDATKFIGPLRQEMTDELLALQEALPRLDWLKISDRRGGRIVLTPLDADPEPRNLRRLKAEIRTRWGLVPLLDMLKEAALRIGILDHFAPAGTRAGMDRAELAEKLILCIFGYGTNIGLRAIAAGEHNHTEEELRYTRRRYLSADAVRSFATAIANATLAARRELIWGAGTGAVASDSTHFGAFDQNLFTQYHVRYGGRGVLIYWHIERKSVAINSQLLSCTASEVAAMVEGAIHHRTEMDVETNYVDSHGQSEIGFGITRLLGFDLKPRLKRINHTKLYLPDTELRGRIPDLVPVLSRRGPIRWDLIAQQYDQLIKYATAINNRTASTEAILRRFTRAAAHPTYQAMLEVGRAQRTIFLCRYLRLREEQREVNSGLNVVESWNGANIQIHYGKAGDIASNRRDEQEMSVLCLHATQAAMVYINTLMIQDVLAEDEWSEIFTSEDYRGLTPLIWSHVAMHGEFKLNMNSRLTLGSAPFLS